MSKSMHTRVIHNKSRNWEKKQTIMCSESHDVFYNEKLFIFTCEVYTIVELSNYLSSMRLY